MTINIRTNQPLDEIDQKLYDEYQCGFYCANPLVGDVVYFKRNHLVRRISYIWHDDINWKSSYQTSDFPGNSSYHVMGFGMVSHSGGLHPAVGDLIRTNRMVYAPFWFCHHDILCAGCNVDCEFLVNVWECEHKVI